MARFDSTRGPGERVRAMLQSDLEQARTDPLHGFSAERVRARLEQAIAAEAEPGKRSRQRSPSSARAPRLWLFAASLTLLAAAATLVHRSQPEPTPRGSVSATPTPLANPAPQPAPLAAPAVEMPGVPSTDSASPRALPPRSASAANEPSQADQLLERELAQLARIRSTLATSPERALALADAGHRDFKGGVMHEEREALAVMALSKLPSPAAFEARARRFLKAYPKSGFRERIASLLPAKPSVPTP